MSTLRSTLDELRMDDLSSLGAEALAARLDEIEHAGRVLEAERARGLAEVERRRMFAADGHLSAAAWLAHRLALGVCEGQAELGDLLWLECNAAELNGVSFTKGCYVGQENTARMNWRQKVNRRLVVVPLAASRPERQRAAYPGLGLAVDHLRVEDIAPEWRPAWMTIEDPAA